MRETSPSTQTGSNRFNDDDNSKKMRTWALSSVLKVVNSKGEDRLVRGGRERKA